MERFDQNNAGAKNTAEYVRELALEREEANFEGAIRIIMGKLKGENEDDSEVIKRITADNVLNFLFPDHKDLREDEELMAKAAYYIAKKKYEIETGGLYTKEEWMRKQDKKEQPTQKINDPIKNTPSQVVPKWVIESARKKDLGNPNDD